MLKKVVLSLSLAASAALVAPAAQADETNPVIVHRQAIYKVASGHMGGLKSILALKDGPKENLSYHADSLVAAFQHLGKAFPEGSDKGETKAKANIWTDRAKFDEAGKKAYAAALAMAEAAKTGDQAASLGAFKNLGGTCKACHDDFKKD
ncbi:putative Cytochrome c' [Magnetospirillum sp. LM-5]|uniref:c-type cytochrome n=1 Tax=Magnetospirillum sp. LM-5 TaxID=2681466 RepID=UPI001380F502|nr:cytochrome c [Magnetospirillum sp. LM-5]CAA7615416.1 putative Cytochrome c' [Magnetospirillum sp. LM-5]